jgi:GT2 family glycosyltransferase
MLESSIPKIIHQLWIGPKPAPTNFMNSWKIKNPDFEYIFWNEQEIEKRKLNIVTCHKINDMSEINGKADIIRWEILYEYGGVFIDADSICIEPLDDLLMCRKAFAGYENEKLRPGLVATGTMGFPKNYSLCKDAVEWILNNDVSVERTGKRAWMTVGPGLLTHLLDTKKYPEVNIFPSHLFLPIHHTGLTYFGHSKIYAYQEWGSTKQNYDIMNTIQLPKIFSEPIEWVSILISSYNTKSEYIQQCLESIINQEGHIGIEIVWIDDGSSKETQIFLKKMINLLKKMTRFCKFNLILNAYNRGVGSCLNEGILLCNNEIIFKMDSDDIMRQDRLSKQLNFMKKTPNAVICGSNVQYLYNNNGVLFLGEKTNHLEQLTLTMYKTLKYHWFMNHPTLCYKKSAVLSVGNYNKERRISEDFELELKLLKQYGKIYNLNESLVYYRIHEEQLTYNKKSLTLENIKLREKIIEEIILNGDDGVSW